MMNLVQLEKDIEDTHIALFELDECEKVLKVLKEKVGG